MAARGLSGTGPKAGGPHYLSRFVRQETRSGTPQKVVGADTTAVQTRLDQLKPARAAALSATAMPGVTGESNRLSTFARGVVLCLGPDGADADRQAELARAHGCVPLIVAGEASGTGAIPFVLDREDLATLKGFDAVMLWSEASDLRAARIALAKRSGPLVPLISEADPSERLVLERHVCIDTTAAGGNAALLAANA